MIELPVLRLHVRDVVFSAVLVEERGEQVLALLRFTKPDEAP
jgi:hypothetical protein